MLISYKSSFKRDLFIANKLGIDVLTVYLKGLKNSLDVKEPLTTADLLTYTRSESLFDIQASNNDLVIDLVTIGFLVSQLDQIPNNSILFHSVDNQPKSAETKFLSNLGHESIKIDAIDSIETELYKKLCDLHGFENYEIIKKLQLLKIESEEKALLLEFALLTSNPLSYISTFKPDFILPLFMRGFSLTQESIKTWYNAVKKEDEVQLGLSLLFNKLGKLNTSQAKQAQQTIIQTDYTIKTNNSFSGVLAFQHMLFSLKKYV